MLEIQAQIKMLNSLIGGSLKWRDKRFLIQSWSDFELTSHIALTTDAEPIELPYEKIADFLSGITEVIPPPPPTQTTVVPRKPKKKRTKEDDLPYIPPELDEFMNDVNAKSQKMTNKLIDAFEDVTKKGPIPNSTIQQAKTMIDISKSVTEIWNTQLKSMTFGHKVIKENKLEDQKNQQDENNESADGQPDRPVS